MTFAVAHLRSYSPLERDCISDYYHCTHWWNTAQSIHLFFNSQYRFLRTSSFPSRNWWDQLTDIIYETRIICDRFALHVRKTVTHSLCLKNSLLLFVLRVSFHDRHVCRVNMRRKSRIIHVVNVRCKILLAHFTSLQHSFDVTFSKFSTYLAMNTVRGLDGRTV